jgi:hypothetical protein
VDIQVLEYLGQELGWKVYDASGGIRIHCLVPSGKIQLSNLRLAIPDRDCAFNKIWCVQLEVAMAEALKIYGEKILIFGPSPSAPPATVSSLWQCTLQK